jgi:HEAT repeat protein
MIEAFAQGLEHAEPSGPSDWRDDFRTWLSSRWPRQPVLQMGFALSLLAVGLIVGGIAGRRSNGAVAVQPFTEIAALRNELAETRQMVALSLMQHESASDRLKGVSWNYESQKPGNEVLAALLDTLIHDPNINVRLAAVDALRQFGDQPVARRGVVDAIAKQQSPMVQIALIDLVVDLHEKESVNTLKQLAQDQTLNVAVRERAGKGLATLE